MMADLEGYQRRLEALDPSLSDRPDDAIRLRDLAFAEGILLEGDQKVADADNEVQVQEAALAAISTHHPDRGARLYDLANAYAIRHRAEYERKDQIKSLQELARVHGIRFQDGQFLELEEISRHLLLESPDPREFDLVRSIQLYHDALTVTPAKHPDRAARLTSLGIAYALASDDDQALDFHQQALDATPCSHSSRPLRLHNLATSYHNLYSRSPDLWPAMDQGYQRCIQLYQEAFDETPESHPERISRFVDLAIAVHKERKKTVADTDRAIEVYQQGLDLIHQCAALEGQWEDETRMLSFIGDAYETRHKQTGDAADLHQALSFWQQAIDQGPPTDPSKVEQLLKLGKQYENLFHESDDLRDLDLAIELYEKATVFEDPSVDQGEPESSLAEAYHTHFSKTNDIDDLNKAIRYFDEALSLIPLDGSRREVKDLLLWQLASAFKERWEILGSASDLEKFSELGQEALEYPKTFASIRMQYAIELIATFGRLQMWQHAYRAASAAVSLIPLLSSRYEGDEARLKALTEYAGLASDAAAIALLAGKGAYEAMRLVDLGRGIIVGSLSDDRSDLSGLQLEHPRLANQFVERRDQLQDASPELNNEMVFAAQGLERTIMEIRVLPGYERFLMIPSEDELIAAAKTGAIVVVNVSRYRCDALIVQERGLLTQPLPHLYQSGIQARLGALTHPKSFELEVLEWLWDAVAAPILDVLGLNSTPQEGSWSRVWWIPTGLLTKFPIHAAGYHYRGSRTVLDRVISSYSSSIRGLLQNRQKEFSGQAKGDAKRAVLVGMAQTPGRSSLPSVPLEFEKLQRIFSNMSLKVELPHPSQKEVLSAMRTGSIFHFAGHGSTDRLDPLQSALLLADGRMTVETVFQQNLGHMPFLAYLSACGTGQVKQDDLMDEGIHLVAAYQLAGFRHVIGTLWSVDDRLSVEAAVGVYEWMRRHNLDDRSPSEALHHTIRKLRDDAWAEEGGSREPRQAEASGEKPVEDACSDRGSPSYMRNIEACEDPPLYWVPYVHFGV